MATAYKCDRCGVFYENKPENKAGLSISRHHSVKDICGSCIEELARFWFEPINTQKKEKENV